MCTMHSDEMERIFGSSFLQDLATSDAFGAAAVAPQIYCLILNVSFVRAKKHLCLATRIKAQTVHLQRPTSLRTKILCALPSQVSLLSRVRLFNASQLPPS